MRTHRALLLALLAALAWPPAAARAQDPAGDFTLAPGAAADDSALAGAMAALARRLITAYAEPDRERRLDTLFRLQLVAGQYADAAATIRDLAELRRATSPAAAARLTSLLLLAKVLAEKPGGGPAFEEAYARAFRETFARMDDATAVDAVYGFGGLPARAVEDFRAALARVDPSGRLTLAGAVDLVRKYQIREALTVLVPLGAPLAAEDNARRFVVERGLLVETPDGAKLDVTVVRQKSAAAPQPALLGFTIYVDDRITLDEATRSAAHGYVGAAALTRGKGLSPGAAVPYEHDGDDARAVIEWLARQQWCDGRVGMFGGSYNGFTQWAAAKRPPRALKAMMPSVTNVPGIDTPMQGNVFLNFVYPWGPYVTNVKGLDEADYGNAARWTALFRTWYTSGRPYRALEAIDGRPNPVFRRWLEHPAYDAYWQRLVPYGREFARVDIPVLTTTGYYDGGQVGALYTFAEHTKHNPRAEHYLLVGPWDHFGAQVRPSNVVQGYAIDPVARVDIQELRYQWFDYALKGGKKPDLLRDRVNYEVMGANVWKHAPSLEAMGARPTRYHLDGTKSGDFYRLSAGRPGASAVSQTIDLADRSDVDAPIATAVVDERLDRGGGVALVTPPFDRPAEVSGLFSGRLDFVVNKRDFDVAVDLYELTSDGKYVSLTVTPAYLGRASYAASRSERRLLVPGARGSIRFRSERTTSRVVGAGSRLVVVLAVPKSVAMQINYGTGKDVSDESVLDAREPLRVRWLPTSFIDIPVRR